MAPRRFWPHKVPFLKQAPLIGSQRRRRGGNIPPLGLVARKLSNISATLSEQASTEVSAGDRGTARGSTLSGLYPNAVFSRTEPAEDEGRNAEKSAPGSGQVLERVPESLESSPDVPAIPAIAVVAATTGLTVVTPDNGTESQKANSQLLMPVAVEAPTIPKACVSSVSPKDPGAVLTTPKPVACTVANKTYIFPTLEADR